MDPHADPLHAGPPPPPNPRLRDHVLVVGQGDLVQIAVPRRRAAFPLPLFRFRRRADRRVASAAEDAVFRVPGGRWRAGDASGRGVDAVRQLRQRGIGVGSDPVFDRCVPCGLELRVGHEQGDFEPSEA